MSELKPCPFCGGEATIPTIDSAHRYHVQCSKCRKYTWCSSRDRAIADWNARSDTYALGEAVERVKRLKGPAFHKLQVGLGMRYGPHFDLWMWIVCRATPAEIMAACDEAEG